MLSMNLEITETIFLNTEKDKPSQNLCLALDIWIFLYQYFQEVKRCVKAKKKYLPDWTLLNIGVEELGVTITCPTCLQTQNSNVSLPLHN